MKFQSFLIVLLLVVVAGLTIPDALGQFGGNPSTLIPPKPAMVEDDVIEAKAGDTFHRAIIRAAVKARQKGDLTRAQVIRLRLAMISPAFRAQVKQLCQIQMVSSGEVDSIPMNGGQIDWDKLATFLEKVLPLILEFLDVLFDIIGKLAVDVQPMPVSFDSRLVLVA